MIPFFNFKIHNPEYMRVEQHTLIPPQLHPAFVLTKNKIGMAEPHQHDEEQRESQLA